jgi:hypothetical protein
MTISVAQRIRDRPRAVRECAFFLRKRIEHFTSSRVKELEVEELGAFAQGVNLAGAIDEMIADGAGIVVNEVAAQRTID